MLFKGLAKELNLRESKKKVNEKSLKGCVYEYNNRVNNISQTLSFLITIKLKSLLYVVKSE